MIRNVVWFLAGAVVMYAVLLVDAWLPVRVRRMIAEPFVEPYGDV